MRLDRLRREQGLVRKDEVRQWVKLRTDAVLSALRALPGKLAPMLAGQSSAEAERIAECVLRDTFNRLASDCEAEAKTYGRDE